MTNTSQPNEGIKVSAAPADNTKPSDLKEPPSNTTAAHSDCELSQSSTSWDHNHSRRSSLRQSTKQRTQHSPRWRDQQEQQLHIDADSFALNEYKVATIASSQRDVNTNIHSPACSTHSHHSSNLLLHEHNDSASQTSHTYSDNAEAYSHHSFEHHESSS